MVLRPTTLPGFQTLEGFRDQVCKFYSACRMGIQRVRSAMSPKDIADLEMKKSCQFEIKGNNPPSVSLENFMSGTYIYEVELNNRWRQQSTMMLIK